MFCDIIISLLCISSVTSKFSPDFGMEWNEFVASFNKSYSSTQEEMYRFNIWRRNLDVIDKHNKEADSGFHSYRLGMNRYGDMTSEEFLESMTGYIPQDLGGQKGEFENFHTPLASLPLLVDWRRKGYVTPVKDQYQCGSCWAFSATGALEGQHFKKTGKLVSLSEQNLVDCSYTEGNNGCYGGLMRYAFQYVANNSGIDLEEFYKYIGANHLFCHYKKIFKGATATGYKAIQQNNETALQIAVATVGPISVSMAALDTFQLYKSGVYYNKDCVGADLNHGVLIVGYGTYIGDDYWLVKNSWGADWGMEGYFMMARNRGNACGLASDASYPTM